jgi:protein tyrosine kinase modulator
MENRWMKKLVLNDPFDILVFFDRRKWWLVLTMVPIFAIGALVTFLLPRFYASETLVLVEPKDVPDDVVKDFITLDTFERLTAIQETVISRTNLRQVLNEFPEAFQDIRHLTEDLQIERIRKRIKIEVTTNPRGRTSVVPYFKISYEDRDPHNAQDVTRRLTRFFIDYDTSTREQQVFGTSEFLKGERDKIGRDLQEVEQVLASHRERYRYELPEQLETNLRHMDRVQGELVANGEERDRYLTLQIELEQRLSETAQYLEPEELPVSQGGRRISEKVQEFRAKDAQLRQLQTRYTDNHPDIKILKEELGQLRSEIPPEDLEENEPEDVPGQDGAKDEDRILNPVYQNLQASLTKLETEMKINAERRDRLNNSIAVYSRRIENTPQREQAVSSQQRLYENLQERYQDLENKLSEAELAMSAESRQKGEQFKIVDPASFPLGSSKPNRMLVLMGSLVVALGVGFSLAALSEFLDQKIWTHAEIKQLSLPVLGEIAAIMTEDEARKRRRNSYLMIVITFCYALLWIGAISAFYFFPLTHNFGTETMASILGW